MQLLEKTDQIIEQLKADSNEILSNPLSLLEKHQQIANIYNESLPQLNELIKNAVFTDRQTEIEYFKEKLPLLYGQYFYHASIYQFETTKPIDNNTGLRKYYQKQLKKIREKSKQEMELQRYLRRQATFNDGFYFTRSGSQQTTDLDMMLPVIDPRCCTIYSLKVAQLKALETLKDHLSRAIVEMEAPESGLLPSIQKGGIVWTDTKNNLIELIYAIHAKGCCNHGKATLKQLFSLFGMVLGVDLGNYSRSFQNILHRKMQSAAFVKGLVKSLEERIDTII